MSSISLVSAFTTVTASIGIVGNILIILLIGRFIRLAFKGLHFYSVRKSLKSAVDILIINLAAADCLYCFGLPIWANDLVQLRRWDLGKPDSLRPTLYDVFRPSSV